MQYWNSSITKDNAIYTEAVFSSYKESCKYGKVNELILHFENHDYLIIGSNCCSQEVVNEIHSLNRGSILKIYYHPGSHKIMEMTCNSKTILQFGDSVSKFSQDRQAFTALGIIMYCGTVYGIILLIRERKK